jgi:hypothetical protein
LAATAVAPSCRHEAGHFVGSTPGQEAPPFIAAFALAWVDIDADDTREQDPWHFEGSEHAAPPAICEWACLATCLTRVAAWPVANDDRAASVAKTSARRMVFMSCLLE